MQGYILEKATKVLWDLVALVNELEATKTTDEQVLEAVHNNVYSALWDVTKIASAASETEWYPEDRDLVLRERRAGVEKLLVRYGWISETTEQKMTREIAEFAQRVLEVAKLSRGDGRTQIHQEINSCNLSFPALQQLSSSIEAVTMGDKSWESFQLEAEVLLRPLIDAYETDIQSKNK